MLEAGLLGGAMGTVLVDLESVCLGLSRELFLGPWPPPSDPPLCQGGDYV